MLNQQLEHIVFQDHYFLFSIFFIFFVHNGGFHFLKQLNSALLCLRNRGCLLIFQLFMHLPPWSDLKNSLYNFIILSFLVIMEKLAHLPSQLRFPKFVHHSPLFETSQVLHYPLR